MKITSADLQRRLSVRFSARNEVLTWVGFFNPGTVQCNSATACNNEVYWADGEVFLKDRIPSMNLVNFNAAQFSAVYKTSNNFVEDEIGDKTRVLPYICEINCALGDFYLLSD